MEKKIAIYKVGGAVRDRLLNQPINDIDWVVVGADAETMLANGYQAVGADFPVFLHPQTKEEYALARTERKSGKGYGGFTFYASPDVTLEQDLARRDLTINAMAEDEAGQLYDPYNGLHDIQQKILRHVSPAFVEDPLRVLRVARFAARYAHLGFTIAPETLKLMTQLSQSGELQALTAERIWQEFSKALMETNPDVFLQVLKACDALPVLLPELTDITLVTEVLTLAVEQTSPLIIRWAILMLPMALVGQVKPIKAINDRFKTPSQYADLALLTGQYLTTCQQSLTISAEALLTFMQRVDVFRRPERLALLLAVVELLTKATGKPVNQTRYPNLIFLEKVANAVRQVDVKPLLEKGLEGAALGKALITARLAVINGLIVSH